jgi:L-malate glycosyltransferase
VEHLGFIEIKGGCVMNLVIISPQIYPCVTGGVEVFNYYFLKEMSKRNIKVFAFVDCRQLKTEKNIHVEQLTKKFLLHPTLSINLHILIKFLKLRKKIDIVHVPYTSNSYLSFPVLLARIFFGIPYIIIIHGGGLYPWKPKVLHKLFFKNAVEIIAVSEAVKVEYEKRSNRCIKVIPPLIPFLESDVSKNELRRKYGYCDNDKIILYLGSIKTIKGSDILLNSFLKLGENYIKKNNLKLLYVGEGPMKTDLQRKVNDQNFSQNVKFFGKIPYEKVPQMYKLSDIFVIPSLFESASIVLLEAMFNGLPIIGSNVYAINDLVKNEKNGLLFKKQDEVDLMEKIKILVENETLSITLGKSAKKDYFENYAFENVITEHVNLINGLLRSKS